MKDFIKKCYFFVAVIVIPAALFWYLDINKEIVISFWGSYLGGVSTLVAVYLTINQTRRLQIDNQKQQERNERKKFADDIAELVGRYITDISNYYYFSRNEKYDRTVAIECFFVLRIKLDKIDSAKELNSILLKIHNQLCHRYENGAYTEISNEFNYAIEQLREAAADFAECYTKL